MSHFPKHAGITIRVVVATFMFGWVCASANAGFMKAPFPDVYVQDIFGGYGRYQDHSDPLGLNGYRAGAENVLWLEGSAVNLRIDSSPTGHFPITPPSSAPMGFVNFTLDAVITPSGVLQSGGTFEVTGTTSTGPGTSPSIPLLKGTLTEINASMLSSQGTLEFKAVLDSSNSQFSSVFGSEVVLNITGLGAGIDFSATYFTTSSATADIGRPVPEPSAAVIWCLGLCILSGRRLRSA